MKRTTFLALSLCAAFLWGCKEDPVLPSCACRELEDCVDDICVLQDNAFYLGRFGIQGHNLYVGIVPGGIPCGGDTVLLDVKPDSMFIDNRFSFMALRDEGRVLTQMVNYASLIHGGEYDYHITGFRPMCQHEGKPYLYAARFRVTPDSVNMMLLVAEEADISKRDSTYFTLYKRLE